MRLHNSMYIWHWHYIGQNRSLSLQAEEIGIECGAENVFFCESENGTKSIKVNLLILIVDVHFLSQSP